MLRLLVCISLFLPSLPKFSHQSYSNGLGSLGNLGSNGALVSFFEFVYILSNALNSRSKMVAGIKSDELGIFSICSSCSLAYIVMKSSKSTA